MHCVRTPGAQGAAQAAGQGRAGRGIEAVGLHYMKSLLHKIEIVTNVETEPSEMLNEIIYSTRPVCAAPALTAACMPSIEQATPRAPSSCGPCYGEVSLPFCGNLLA